MSTVLYTKPNDRWDDSTHHSGHQIHLPPQVLEARVVADGVTCPSPSCVEESKAEPDPEAGLQFLPCEILLSVFWSEAKGGKSPGFQGLRN